MPSCRPSVTDFVDSGYIVFSSQGLLRGTGALHPLAHTWVVTQEERDPRRRATTHHDSETMDVQLGSSGAADVALSRRLVGGVCVVFGSADLGLRFFSHEVPHRLGGGNGRRFAHKLVAKRRNKETVFFQKDLEIGVELSL